MVSVWLFCTGINRKWRLKMETIIAKIKHKDDAAALEAAQIEADNQ